MTIIKPFETDEAPDAVTPPGVRGVTGIRRGAEHQISYLPKVKLEIAVSDDMAGRAITGAAHTDKTVEGEIFVFDMERAIRIGAGETGSAAR